MSFPLQQWLHERACMLRYTYMACIFFLGLAPPCLSVRPHGTTRPPFPLKGFSWNLALENFSKICRDNPSFVKNVTRKTGTLHEDLCTLVIPRWILRSKNSAEKKKLQRNSKPTFHVQYFFFFENPAVCEIMWKNMVQPDRPQIHTQNT